MIGEQQKNMIFPVVFSAVIVLLLGWYILVCCDYPYYFMWDMDHVTCLDTVLIQSGLLPDHICHPSSGMYLPLIFQRENRLLFRYSFSVRPCGGRRLAQSSCGDGGADRFCPASFSFFIGWRCYFVVYGDTGDIQDVAVVGSFFSCFSGRARVTYLRFKYGAKRTI